MKKTGKKGTKKFKQFFAMVLALSLVYTMFPALTAYAAVNVSGWEKYTEHGKTIWYNTETARHSRYGDDEYIQCSGGDEGNFTYFDDEWTTQRTCDHIVTEDPTLTVTFNANGHGSAPEAQIVSKKGKAIEPQPLPTATGFRFDGWYIDSTCTGEEWNFNNEVTSNITLYAKWVELTHTWNYSATGATLTATCDKKCPEKTTHTATLSLVSDPSNYSGNIQISGLEEFNKATGKDVKPSDINYFKTNTMGLTSGGTSLPSIPTEEGYYYASLTVGNVTALKAFAIIKSSSAVNHDKSKESGNLEGSGLNNSSAELFEKVLTKEEQAAVNNGATANVWLDVKAKEAKTVSDTDANKIKKAAPSGYHVSSRGYIDINIWKQIGTASATTVPNLQGKVSITVKVPAELQKSGRAYKVIRLHNDVAETLETKQDANYNLTFETDGFSTYAIAYSDATSSATVTSAKTGETSMPLALVMLAISMFGVAYFTRKRV